MCSQMTERFLESYFVKAPSVADIPEGFSFTGQQTAAPTVNLTKGIEVRPKRANHSKVYSAVASVFAPKKDTTVLQPRGYKKGSLYFNITCDSLCLFIQMFLGRTLFWKPRNIQQISK